MGDEPALNEDDALETVRRLLEEHAPWWSEAEVRIVMISGGYACEIVKNGSLANRTKHQQPTWLSGAQVTQSRFEHWVLANIENWASGGYMECQHELWLDTALLMHDSLQVQSEFSSAVLDLARTCELLAPLEVAEAIPAAMQLSPKAVCGVWRWLPNVAHRYLLAPSRGHLLGPRGKKAFGIPSSVVREVVRLWRDGPTNGYEFNDKIFAKGYHQLKKMLGPEKLSALVQ